MGMCKATLTGRVIKDPEKRLTSSNEPVTTFAIDIGENNSSDLVRVVAWRSLAETCAKSVSKNSVVIVDGRLQLNSYTDSSGANKKSVEIVANQVMLTGSAALSEQKSESSKKKADEEELIPDDLDMTPDQLIDEDEIPF